MGRRHELFTLVGIAGEDDTDAPDLAAPANTLGSSGRSTSGNGSAPVAPPSARRNGKLSAGPRKPVLTPPNLAASGLWQLRRATGIRDCSFRIGS